MKPIEPVAPWQVYEGGNYWAAWGSKGWSAIKTISVKRKWIDVLRVDQKTNLPRGKQSKVRIDELVKRDPKQKGADKPSQGPAAIFKQIRDARETDIVGDDWREPKKTPSPERSATQKARDDWTKEQWDDFLRGSWDGIFGEGSWETQPTSDDW